MCRWFDSAPGHQIYTVVSQGTAVFLFVLTVLNTPSARCPHLAQAARRCKRHTASEPKQLKSTAACDLYDEARYRQRLGLAHQAHTFAQIAHQVLAELRQQIDAGSGKTAYHSYVSCIERYFVPYFGDK